MKQETVIRVLETIVIAIKEKYNIDNLLPMVEETIKKTKEEGIEN